MDASQYPPPRIILTLVCQAFTEGINKKNCGIGIKAIHQHCHYLHHHHNHGHLSYQRTMFVIVFSLHSPKNNLAEPARCEGESRAIVIQNTLHCSSVINGSKTRSLAFSPIYYDSALSTNFQIFVSIR